MFKNHLRIAWRNLAKNNLFLLVNVAGLALALSTCTIAYFNTTFALGFDEFHENIDELYKVHIRKNENGNLSTHGINPIPLGPAISQDLAQVGEVVRVMRSKMMVGQGKQRFPRQVAFVDEAFFDLFTFRLQEGNADLLRDKSSVFLSQQMAHTYFRDRNPIGESIILTASDNREYTFQVAGVLQKIAANSTISFDLAINYDNYLKINHIKGKSWREFTAATFLSIAKPEDVRSVEELLSRYIEAPNQANPDWEIESYELQPLRNFALDSQHIYSNWLNAQLHPANVIAPPLLALLIMLVACFNFTNTTLALANRRIKEIGIRKAVGGTKPQLVAQFMGENVLICFLAILVSLILSNYLVPAYGALWEGVDLKVHFDDSYGFYLFLFIILIVTSFIAGAYPSLYVSSFSPTHILRGTIDMAESGKLSKVLLAGQYLLTVVALFTTLAFMQNAHYQNEADLGFNRDDIIGVPIGSREEYLAIQTFLNQSKEIASFAGTRHHLGKSAYSETIKDSFKSLPVSVLDLGTNYLEVMDISLLKGRGFKDNSSERSTSIIVNEQTVRSFGWDEPLGQKVWLNDSTQLTVVGIVKDFYHHGFWRKAEPFAIRPAVQSAHAFLIAKVEDGQLESAFQHLHDHWNRSIPNKPFEGFYQDQLDIIREAKATNTNIVIIFCFLAFIAVILSGLGLFTLVSLSVMKRLKEIGIRRTLGAPVSRIVRLINRPYLLIVLGGSLLGLGVGYYLTNKLVSSIFELHQPTTLTTYLLPLLLVLVLSIAVSAARILAAALSNPVKSLRYE